MGLMDKVKAQAGQLAEKAQHGIEVGKDKVEDLQAKKKLDAAYKDLGAAYFAQQKEGGPADAVATALAAVETEKAAIAADAAADAAAAEAPKEG